MLLKKRLWRYATIATGVVGLAGAGGYLFHRRGALLAEEREEGILKLAAVALSKETIKDLITDKEVLHDLKKIGLDILNHEDTKEELKKLVKERACDKETQEILKRFLSDHVAKDMWVQEELLRLVSDVATDLKEDKTIFPNPLLARVGSAALIGLQSDYFLQNLKTAVKSVGMETFRGPPSHPPTRRSA